MNSQKIKIGIFLIVIAILVAGGWLLWKGGNSDGFNSQSSSSTNTPSTNWKVYENTAYGYKLSYPSNMEVARVQDIDPHPITEVDDIYVSWEGSELFITAVTGSSSVTILTSDILAPTGPNQEAQLAEWERKVAQEKKQFIALDIRSFAEEIRQNQVNDKNPNVRNKQVGELKKISFAGKVAYSFTLTESFNSDPSGKYGYTIAGVHNYIFVENSANQKIILHYPVEDSLSEQIKNSFEFTE